VKGWPYRYCQKTTPTRPYTGSHLQYRRMLCFFALNIGMITKPQNEIVERPDIPYWLNAAEKRIWDYIIPKIEDAGHLTRHDGELLGRYCATMYTYLLAKDARDKYGALLEIGQAVKSNPALHAMAEAGRDLDHILAQFGMSPSARGSLNDAKDNDMDILQKIVDDFRNAQ
jgi:P27 family predicted phage terminase small subunit